MRTKIELVIEGADWTEEHAIWLADNLREYVAGEVKETKDIDVSTEVVVRKTLCDKTGN